MGEHDDRRPDLSGSWSHGPYAVPTGPATWVPPLVARKKRPRRGPVLTAVALAVVLLVGAGLFLFLRDDAFVLDGRYVTEPQAVLDDADRALAGYVEQRHGVRADDSRCWFEATAADGDDVRDSLLCGPVLFVDGYPGRSWLRFPLDATPDGGDVRLAVADLPVDPAPEALADPALLRRPDGGSPATAAGGLEVPPPPRAEPGYSAVGPFAGVTYTAPSVPSRLSGPAAAFTVTGLASPDRSAPATTPGARPRASGSSPSPTRSPGARGSPRPRRPPPTRWTAARRSPWSRR